MSIHWNMYRSRGAGRWAESSSGARGLPYKPPAYVCTAARRDALEGNKSLLCLPYRATVAAAVWTEVAKARGARSPRGQSPPPPPLASTVAEWGGGGRSMSAMDVVAFGCGRLGPGDGDRRRGTARLHRAAEMRPKTSGSDAGGSAVGRGGGGGLLCWEGALWCRWCPQRASLWMGAWWRRPGVASGGCWGENGSTIPPPGCAGPTLTALPWSAGRSGLGRFGDVESSGPRAQGGASPQRPGGGRGAPARHQGARDWEGLGGGVGPAEPGG